MIMAFSVGKDLRENWFQHKKGLEEFALKHIGLQVPPKRLCNSLMAQSLQHEKNIDNEVIWKRFKAK